MVNLNIKSGIDTTSSTNAFIPTGALIMKAIPPSALSSYTNDYCISSGYVPCDGRALNSSTYTEYANLYSIIANIYGGTNGTDFKVPDLRTSRRYIYGQGSSSGGVYTPSFSANTTNTVTHQHALVVSSSSLSTNAVQGSHYHNINSTLAAGGGANHYHNANANFSALNATNAVGTTLTKADGTGTAAGAAHAHSTGAFGTNSTSGWGGTTHNHGTIGQNYVSSSDAYTEPAHSHTVSSQNVSIPTSGAIDIPYINMLYFIKI